MRRRSTRYELVALVGLLVLWAVLSWATSSMVLAGLITVAIGLVLAVVERRLGRR